jgi:hypothetical protein
LQESRKAGKQNTKGQKDKRTKEQKNKEKEIKR